MIETEILNQFHVRSCQSACLPHSLMFSPDTTEALLLGDSAVKSLILL